MAAEQHIVDRQIELCFGLQGLSGELCGAPPFEVDDDGDDTFRFLVGQGVEDARKLF